MSFDPDAYLAEDPTAAPTGGTVEAPQVLPPAQAPGFDPDAYLGATSDQKATPDTQAAPFNADAYLEEQAMREELAGYDAAAAQRAYRAPEGVKGKLSRFNEGTVNVVADSASGALRLGALMLPDADRTLNKMADGVEAGRAKAKDALRAAQNPAQDENLSGMLVSGVGQFAPQIMAAPVRGLALVANASQFYAQEYNAAKEKGSSEGEAVASGLLNMPAAALDYVMERAIVGRFMPKDAPKTVGSLLRAFGLGGTGEVVTETAQNKWGDFIAGTLVATDPNRDLGVQYSPENIDRTLGMDAKVGTVAFVLGSGASGLGELARPDTGAPVDERQAPRTGSGVPFDPDAYLATMEGGGPAPIGGQAEAFESTAAQAGVVDPLLTEPEPSNDQGPGPNEQGFRAPPPVEQPGIRTGEGLAASAAPAADESSGVPATETARPAEAAGEAVGASPLVPAAQPVRRRSAPTIPYAPLGQPDVVDFVAEAGGIQPTTRGGERDDKTENLKGVYAPLAKGTRPPDVMAQMAYDAGLIDDPTAPALWTALGRTVEARQRARAAESAQDSADATRLRESRTLARAMAPGRGMQAVPVDTLNVGDTLTARGRTVTVRSVDPDTGDVEVDAGTDLDFQRIPAGTVVHAEQVARTGMPALAMAGADAPFSTESRKPGVPAGPIATPQAVVRQATQDGRRVRFVKSVLDIADRGLRARMWAGGYNGTVVQGADGQPEIVIVLDRVGSEAEALRVYREEAAHIALRTGLAADYSRTLEDFATLYLTSEDLAPLMALYPQAEGESDAAYRLRLADEFIAKQGRENPQGDLWQRFVEAIREMLAKAGLTQLTAQEAANAILKRAQSRSVEAAGSADADMRFSTPENVPTFDPARPLIAAGANLPTEVRPVLGGMEHVKALEMPELVRLTETLTGELPKLRKLRKAHGLFKPLGRGLIKLDPRIFTNPVEAAKTLAHEIGHLVDYLGGDDVPPTLKRGNLLGRMATLNNFLKTSLPTLPDGLVGAQGRMLTTDDRTRMRTEAARMAGPRPGKENAAKQLGWANEVRMHYRQMVAKEAKARGLTTLQMIRGELLDLSREWRGDWADAPASYQRYRESGKELYADAMSVLFNNPFLLADRAPTFYTMFWGYLDAKPEVKQALLDVQTLLHHPKLELLGTREERIRAAYMKGDEIFQSKWEEQKARLLNWRGWLAGLKTELYNTFDPIIRRQRQVEKLGPLEQKQRIDWLLDAHPLGDNRVYLLLQRIQARVIDELEGAGISRDTLGLYLQMKRIQNEQYEIAPDGVTPEQEKDRLISGRRVLANPEGHTPETARAALLKLRLDLGMERMTALERAAERFHDIVFEQMGEATEAGLIDRQTFVRIITPNRKNYATFVPLKYWDTFVSSRIAQQVGSLEAIGNPFTATVMKLIALNRAAHENRARVETVRFMGDFFGQEIAPAETIFDGRGQRPQEPKEAGKALLTTRENGRTVGYVVPEDVGLMFEHLSAEHKMTTIRMLSAAFRNVVYPLIIRFNPVFQLATSPIRDFQRLMVNVPDGSRGRVAREYFKELWRSIADPSSSAQRVRLDGMTRPGPNATPTEVEAWQLAQEMMHKMAIWTPFESYGRGLQEKDTFAQILQKYHLLPEDKKPAWLDNMLMRPLAGLLHKIEYAGQVLEGMPKTVAYKVATKDLGWDREQAGVYVRNHIGVPNFTKRGKQAYIANAVMPFWTVFLNGWESDYRQATGKVQGKSQMGWWLGWMVFGGGMLKLAQTLAEEGLFGEELEEMLAGVSENDKSLLGILPLGFTEGGDHGKKVVYLRIPQDETSRTISALMRHGIKAMAQMARGEPLDEGQRAFATAYGATPSLNPILQVASGWGTFLAGNNPVDSYRGSAVLSNSEYLAGGLPAVGAMGYWTLEKTGMTNLVRYDRTANTTLEHFIGGVPIANSLMRISDAGYRQRQQAMERQEDAASARVRISFSKDVQKLATELNYLRSLGSDSRTTEQTARYYQLKQWERMHYDPAREQTLDNPEDKDLARQQREAVNRSANDYIR